MYPHLLLSSWLHMMAMFARRAPVFLRTPLCVGLNIRGLPRRSLARPGGRVQVKGRELEQGGGIVSATFTAAAVSTPASVTGHCCCCCCSEMPHRCCAVLSQSGPSWWEADKPGVQASFWWRFMRVVLFPRGHITALMTETLDDRVTLIHLYSFWIGSLYVVLGWVGV